MSRVRVLHIVEASEGGVARHLSDLVLHLNQERFENSILVATGRLEFFHDQLAKIQAAGIRVDKFDLARRINMWQDWRAMKYIRRFIQMYDPEIVHLHSSKAGFLGRIAARRCPRQKFLYTPHGFYFQGLGRLKRIVFQQLEKVGAQRCAAYICVSESEAQLAMEVGIDRSVRIAVIPNGISAVEYIPKTLLPDHPANCSIPDDAVVIAQIGRFVHQKGWDLFPEIVEYVSKRNESAVFLAVGYGRQEAWLREEVERRNLASKVYWSAFLPDVTDILNQCDILLNSSRFEGLSYVLLEGMASGLPVVATAVVGNIDLVKENVSGFLVPKREVALIGNALLKLVEDQSARQQMGEAGRALVVNRYSRQQFLAKMEELYMAIL